MARKKKKTKRRTLPPNRGAGERVYNDFTAALETVYSEISAVGESMELLREQTSSRLNSLEEQILQLDRRVTTLEVKISEDMAYLKHEIRLIRHDLSQKVNREEFEMLEGRVTRLEKELAVR